MKPTVNRTRVTIIRPTIRAGWLGCRLVAPLLFAVLVGNLLPLSTAAAQDSTSEEEDFELPSDSTASLEAEIKESAGAAAESPAAEKDESTSAEAESDASESEGRTDADTEESNDENPAETAKPEKPPVEPIGSARKAFDHWFGYPWYDKEHDALRPVTLLRQSNTKRDLSFLNIFAWIGLALLLVALAYFLIQAYVLRESNAAQTTETRLRHVPVEVSALEALPFQVRRPTADLLEEARRQYEQGHYTEAIIYLFSYQLVQLDRHQLIRLAKGKTNRQYLREVGSSRPLGKLLEHTMVIFEGVFFGSQGLERLQFESAWNRLADFDRLVLETGR